jgi:K+-sensing histidine kinase KdpD
MSTAPPPHILYLDGSKSDDSQVVDRLEQLGCGVVRVIAADQMPIQLQDECYDLILLNLHLVDHTTSLPIQWLNTENLPPILVLLEDWPTADLLAQLVGFDIAGFLFHSSDQDYQHVWPISIERAIQKYGNKIEQGRTVAALQQDNRNLTLLTRLAQILTSTLDVQQITSQLVQAISEIVVTEGSSVWLKEDEQGGPLVCAAMYLAGQDITAHKLEMAPGQGIVGWVAQHGQPANVQHVVADDRFSPVVDSQTGYTTQSILAVPLITRHQVIGVLEFVNKIGGPFDERDRELAETVATYAANAIEDARLMESVSRQRDRLERQNEALDAFAHTVAHDLKNPLSLIVGFADLVRDSFDTLPRETIQESLDTIVEYGIKMSSIVDALLMLASVGSDEEVVREQVDMGKITQAVIRRIEYQIRDYEAKVIAPKNWPAVLGNSSWLEEVWYNYLSNGLKYGGRPPRLKLGYDELGDGIVRFWVQDNGPGLPTANPADLFQPLHNRQRNRQHSRQQNGHGLGLSIVQRIISRLGGEVGAESVAGRGSRFSFTLPASPTASTE